MKREEKKMEKKEYNKKYYEENKEEFKKYQEKYRKEHDREIKEYQKEWREMNKTYSLNYKNLRRKNDNKFRIVMNLRARLTNLLRTSIGDCFGLVGCSYDEFTKHIENQFKEGMTWNNYGKDGWVIDHIRPCSSFDLTIKEQQKECFYYTNLQPLWWFENASKGSKYKKEEEKQNE
jgi:hypothetical protein